MKVEIIYDICIFAANLEDKFNKFFEQYHLRLSLYAYRMVGSLEEAEDIVQTLFLNLLERAGELPPIESLKPYLFRAVHNASLNHLKKSKAKTFSQLILDPQLLIDEQEDYLRRRVEDELLWELLGAVEKLPPKAKEIFKMSYLEKMREREIAERLNISIHTVKSQKQRAKEILKGELKDLFPILILLLHTF